MPKLQGERLVLGIPAGPRAGECVCQRPLPSVACIYLVSTLPQGSREGTSECECTPVCRHVSRTARCVCSSACVAGLHVPVCPCTCHTTVLVWGQCTCVCAGAFVRSVRARACVCALYGRGQTRISCPLCREQAPSSSLVCLRGPACKPPSFPEPQFPPLQNRGLVLHKGPAERRRRFCEPGRARG